ncbi:MAG: nicotinic acid mononucleotide adenyltransferase [Flavobacteriaceae bacterium]|nr:MAG: nicotinic acid mononucleotide adenyltransferase [Bacteroidota bacterium]
MKNIYLLFTLLFFLCYTQSGVAQNENKLIEYNEITDLIDITYFYEDGSVQQIGSFNTSGLPHGEWTAYNMNGKKLCIGNYKNGLKDGTWYFILPNEVQSVDYYNSKIISVKNNLNEDIAALK